MTTMAKQSKKVLDPKPTEIKDRNRGDIAFQWVINIISILIGIITLYPLIYVLSASLSQPVHILNGTVWLWPVDLTFNAYSRVFTSDNILIGYRNTLF